MSGYNENFLDGISLALPTFSAELEGKVLNKTSLREGIYADYVNYSVIMNADLRTPLIVALNIDQSKFFSTSRKSWKIDSRIGAEFQLNNDYYRRNSWDRGHMARRSTAAWGDTNRVAQHASNETMYYSNSCLQHENLNQDEWLELENWVKSLSLDIDDKITSFSGPIYGDLNRSIQPSGRSIATIPAGFFKIVCFQNKSTKDLDVRAFIMYQDQEALKDKRGRDRFNNQTYQVSVTEIEELTGLIFPTIIYEKNSLFFRDSENSSKVKADTPEHIEVSTSIDITAKDTPRAIIKDNEIDVFIASSLINPVGNERSGEWISIINLSNKTFDISDWQLQDLKRKGLVIKKALNTDTVMLLPGESIRINPVTPLKLSNQGGIIQLVDHEFNRVDRIKYFKKQVEDVKEGNAVKFLKKIDFNLTDKSVI